MSEQLMYELLFIPWHSKIFRATAKVYTLNILSTMTYITLGSLKPNLIGVTKGGLYSERNIRFLGQFVLKSINNLTIVRK